MKRLNPETGAPFKQGDVRSDGYAFAQYAISKPLRKDGTYQECWLIPEKLANKKEISGITSKIWQYKTRSSKSGHILWACYAAKSRAKKKQIPFDLTPEYLESIAVDICPVFNIDLSWGIQTKVPTQNSPSLDRIDPNLGYVMGNVRWLSQLANMMKQNATNQQLTQFANWVLSDNKEK